MEIQELKQSLDQLGRDWEQFKKDNDSRLKAVESKGVADPILVEKLDKMNAGMDAVSKRLEKIEALPRVPVAEGQPDQQAKAKAAAEIKAAANHWYRKGQIPSECKALTEHIDSEGGFLVRPEISEAINLKVFETSPIMQLADVMDIGSNEYQEPADWSEPDAGWVGETETRTETTASTLKLLSVPVHEIYAEPRATQRLLDDGFVDVEAWHSLKVAEKITRTINTACVSGNGVSKPKGFLSYASGDDYDKIEQVVSGSASLLTSDGLISLQASLFEDFQPNATWLMRRATVAAVRQLKAATTGEYLWGYTQQLNAPFQQTLLGKPVMFASDMPAVAANALAVAYGDFRRGYLIVRRPGIRVLRDNLTVKGFVKFYTTVRIGGGVRHFQAIKLQKVST